MKEKEIHINNALHLEKNGTHLMINHGGKRKSAVLLITDPSENNGDFSNNIRVMHLSAQKHLSIRKYILIDEDNPVSVGPFFIKMDPLSLDAHSASFNVMINSRCYFLSRFPADAYFAAGCSVILFYARIKPCRNTQTAFIDFIKKSGISQLVISGPFTEEYRSFLSGIVKLRCLSITKQHKFEFSEKGFSG